MGVEAREADSAAEVRGLSLFVSRPPLLLKNVARTPKEFEKRGFLILTYLGRKTVCVQIELEWKGRNRIKG